MTKAKIIPNKKPLTPTPKFAFIMQKAMQDKRLQTYLKETGLKFSDVTIKALTLKGWITLQKGVSETEILITGCKIKLVLPL